MRRSSGAAGRAGVRDVKRDDSRCRGVAPHQHRVDIGLLSLSYPALLGREMIHLPGTNDGPLMPASPIWEINSNFVPMRKYTFLMRPRSVLVFRSNLVPMNRYTSLTNRCLRSWIFLKPIDRPPLPKQAQGVASPTSTQSRVRPKPHRPALTKPPSSPSKTPVPHPARPRTHKLKLHC
jgi:hypothetical protein